MVVVGWIAVSLVLTAIALGVGQGLDRTAPRPSISPNQISGWSYPSGHASEIACAMALLVVTDLARMRPGRLRILVDLGAGLPSRCWSGSRGSLLAAHYPSDVVAGCLLGALIAYVLGASSGIVNPQPVGRWPRGRCRRCRRTCARSP